MRVSYYELYEARYGKWSLTKRYQPKDEALARARAEKNWTESRIATVLTQESIDEEGGEMSVTAIYRSPKVPANLRPPDTESNVAGSFVTVAVNGVIIGAIGAVIGAIALSGSPARFFLTILIFLMVSAGAMMVLFRMMMPAELMTWRTKTAEAKRKTIEVLIESNDEIEQPAFIPASQQPGRQRKLRKGAFSHSPGDIIPGAREAGKSNEMLLGRAPSETIDTNAQNAANFFGQFSQPQKLQELIATELTKLNAFAADIVTSLGPRASSLQAFERYGLNLYIAGAAQELAWREALTEHTTQTILGTVITDLGTAPESAKAFCERLVTAADRPRFKAMLDAGRAAMAATLDGKRQTPGGPGIEAALVAWSNPHGSTNLAQRFAVLLTDLVGSTDATRKLGNAGAQRMLRAHNAIIRSALKDNKGVEIKHTGDGILAIFNSPADAGHAAMAIQQDSQIYVRDNPDIPLAIRIGIEYAEGMKDETGEYFGPAFSAIEATCDAAGAGDIAATPVVKERSEGANLRYVPLTPSPTAKSFLPGLFKLLWEPKRAQNVPPLEYRQIGTTPPPPQLDT